MWNWVRRLVGRKTHIVLKLSDNLRFRESTVYDKIQHGVVERETERGYFVRFLLRGVSVWPEKFTSRRSAFRDLWFHKFEWEKTVYLTKDCPLILDTYEA